MDECIAKVETAARRTHISITDMAIAKYVDPLVGVKIPQHEQPAHFGVAEDEDATHPPAKPANSSKTAVDQSKQNSLARKAHKLPSGKPVKEIVSVPQSAVPKVAPEAPKGAEEENEGQLRCIIDQSQNTIKRKQKTARKLARQAAQEKPPS
jgi:hypothetical protein